MASLLCAACSEARAGRAAGRSQRRRQDPRPRRCLRRPRSELAHGPATQPGRLRTLRYPARKLKQLLKLCERAETLVPTEVLDEAGASPAEILAKKWRDQLAANTMGERVDENARRRGAIEEIKRLQSERRRLGSLTGAEASSLQARFQKACDRAYQKNQGNVSTV